MAFGHLPIGKYLLSRRIFPGADAETILELRREPGGTGSVDTAMVYFYANPSPGSVSGSTVYAHLPSEEFELWYGVLQTEKPVSLGWATSDTDATLNFVGLYTSEEPPGEWFDSSP